MFKVKFSISDNTLIPNETIYIFEWTNYFELYIILTYHF